MIVDVVSRQQRQSIFPRQRIEPVDPGDVVAGVEIAGGKMAQRRELSSKVGKEIVKRRGQFTRRHISKDM